MRSKELQRLRYARDKKRGELLWQNTKTWRYSMKTLTSEQIRQFICGYLDIDPNTFEVVRHLFQQMDICAACEDAAKNLGVNVDVE
jgi:hypothetical protein